MRPDGAAAPARRATPTRKKPAAAADDGLDTPIQFIKGVGPKMGFKFASRGIETVRDILTFFPRTYEDRTRFINVKDLEEGVQSTVSVKVVSSRKIPLRNRPRPMFEVRCTDDTGLLKLKWFNVPRGLETRFENGTQITVTGTPKVFMGQPEIIHPEISWGGADSSGTDAEINVGRIIPVYSELEGIPTRQLRKVLWNALEKYETAITEDLPARFLEKHGLPRLKNAIHWIHFPPAELFSAGDDAVQKLISFRTPAHERLIYEEFFKFEYLVLKQRLQIEREKAQPYKGEDFDSAVADLESALPFKLTPGQQEALKAIREDLGNSHPMNRLVQGDVGAGKTAVAFLSAGGVLALGGQAALMAPTEILAEQHYRNAVKLFGGRLRVELLTGRTTAKERERILPRLEGGEPILLIGTHALIEDPVKFRSLDFVLIDEQHRFGVEQRRKLRAKGHRPGADGRLLHTHNLILTATPIPRTLALTAYGDTSVTSIRDLPPGRSPVTTKVVRGGEKAKAYEAIRRELGAGRQAFFIYPLVNDSEAEGFTSLKSAVAESDNLARNVFPDFKVGLLHGQMRPDEKAEVMDRFRRNEIQILVSTTVVEVGVDVPNATVMAIEHSERFGLSQLHQLRGRVGRGSHQSYCFLFTSERLGETSKTRLDVLEATTDGFKIAEADLEIRGPGEFLGTRQAGSLPFRLANLVRDRDWLLRARDDASALLKDDSELEKDENRALRRYYEREGSLQFERLKTS